MKQEDNATGKWVFGMGVALMFAGFLVGLYFLGESSDYAGGEKYTLLTQAILIFVSGVISGTLFIGIGEIVKLLDRMNRN